MTRSIRGRIASSTSSAHSTRSSTPARDGPLLELLHGLLEHRLHGRGAERDDARAGLELREEEHLVDELGDLVDLRPRLLDERRDVLARQRRRLEKRQEPGERAFAARARRRR